MMVLLLGRLLLALFAVLWVVGLQGRVVGMILTGVRRRFIVVAVTLGVGMLAPAIASAEPSGTVSISASPEPAMGQPVSITVGGTSSQAGELAVYMLDSSPVAPGASCPSAQHKEEVNLGDIAPPTPVSAGSYSQTYSFTPGSAGRYVICGYLYDPSSSDTIYAAGTGSFNATVHSQVVASEPSGNTPASTESEPSPKPTPPPPHMTALTVTVRSHAGSTAAQPGHTELLIRAKGGALVLVTLKRQGRSRETEFSYASSDKLNVRWTCNRPGGVYRYTVTARDSYGAILVRHGLFRPVSAAGCRALRQADARRRREGERAEREPLAPQEPNSGTCSSDGIMFTFEETSCATAESVWRSYGTNGVTPAGWYCGGDRYEGGCDTAGINGVVVGAKYVKWQQQ
jgi:hypothetical protein